MVYKLQIGLLVFSTIFLVAVGLAWLALAVLIFFGLFWLLFSDRSLSAKLRKNVFFYWVLMAMVILLPIVFIRVFVLDIYNIPSESMEDTLLRGDKIVVSKISYGPRMPQTPFEIPWVNAFFHLTYKKQIHQDS